MDINLVVLAGTLTAEPELRTFESGATLLRYLVTVRTSEPRRRVDVVPVTLWEPRTELLEDPGMRGRRVFVIGSAQRRYWTADVGKASRIEVVAFDVELRDDEQTEDEDDRVSA